MGFVGSRGQARFRPDAIGQATVTLGEQGEVTINLGGLKALPQGTEYVIGISASAPEGHEPSEAREAVGAAEPDGGATTETGGPGAAERP